VHVCNLALKREHKNLKIAKKMKTVNYKEYRIETDNGSSFIYRKGESNIFLFVGATHTDYDADKPRDNSEEKAKKRIDFGEVNLLNKLRMNSYQKSIIEVTGCDPKDAEEIEEYMRQVYFHSTLDWQTKEQFDKGAKESYSDILWMRSPEGQKYMKQLEKTF
jgi:hypothetical protein